MDKLEDVAMRMAIEEAQKNGQNGFKSGGPFGAVIVKDGEVVAKAHNTVLESCDPTAHAEVNAIREAAKKLGTHDLSGCAIFVNAEPCPMCLSAIIWANIKDVYYANSREDAERIGFRDDMIYKYFKDESDEILKKKRIERPEALKAFEDFQNTLDKTLY